MEGKHGDEREGVAEELIVLFPRLRKQKGGGEGDSPAGFRTRVKRSAEIVRVM